MNLSNQSSQGEIQPRPLVVSPNFPKRLPEFEVGPVVNELGFTLSERLALKQAWNQIRPKERLLGQDVFYRFLNEHYFAMYTFQSNEKLDLHSLHTHARSFVHFIGDLINESDPTMFQFMVHDINQIHNCRHVPKPYIEMLLQALTDSILKALHKITCPTLENGVKRLVGKFKNYMNESDCNAKSTVSYKRQMKRNRQPLPNKQVKLDS